MAGFFYAILAILILLFPIVMGAEGTFRLEKRVGIFSLRLFGIPILRFRFFLSEEGLEISLNGKKSKQAKGKESKEDDKSKPFKISYLSAVRILSFDLSVSMGGDPQVLSVGLASFSAAVQSFMSFLAEKGVADYCRIRVIPCYDSERMTANFSIRIFSSVALFLSALAHTIEGEKNAKRNNRKQNGQDVG